jgi:hypothetical protein
MLVERFRPHPWHGLEVGPEPPDVLNAFIEITPFDFMKYEVDKVSGYLRVDRPQRSSAQPPTLYGFVPRTFCDERVRKLAPGAKRGDGDPVDICVLSERPIARGEIIVRGRLIGGLQMIRYQGSGIRDQGIRDQGSGIRDQDRQAVLPSRIQRMGMYENPSADKFGPPPGQERFEPPKPRRGPQWFALALFLAFYLGRYGLEHVRASGWVIPVVLFGVAVAEIVVKRRLRNQPDDSDPLASSQHIPR